MILPRIDKKLGENYMTNHRSESVEEYLETLWVHEEQKGKDRLAKVSWIADHMDIKTPSAVEQLKKMEANSLVEYKVRKGVELTLKGRKIARQIIRNHRLIEVLMNQTLGERIDEEVACGMEHHMTKEFADALCTQLDHPRNCPHDNPIPRGKCCYEGSDKCIVSDHMSGFSDSET